MRNVFISLPRLVDESYVMDIADEVADVRADGVELCLQFDWHVLEPYHGAPPHLDALVRRGRIGDEGLGYAPFGWTEGWRWVQKEMEKLLLTFQPEAVLYGQDPHVRVGWGFLNGQRDPAVAAYNDTLGILREGLESCGYGLPVLVIPETPGSQIQPRGIKRAMEWGLAAIILPESHVEWDADVDVDDEDLADDLEEELEEIEGEMEENGELPMINTHPAYEYWDKARYWLDQAVHHPMDVPKRAMLRRARRMINKAMKAL